MIWADKVKFETILFFTTDSCWFGVFWDFFFAKANKFLLALPPHQKSTLELFFIVEYSLFSTSQESG